LKSSIKFLWCSVKGKKLTKYYPHSPPDEKGATFGVTFKIDENTRFDLQFSSETPDAIKETCIEKAFEFIKEQKLFNSPNTEYVRFNQKIEDWELINLRDEIEKFRKNKSV